MEKRQSREVTVYSKEQCVQCDATIRKLGQLGIRYEVVMLEQNPELVEQFRSEGLMQAPIVDVDGDKWAGYKPDRIKGILND